MRADPMVASLVRDRYAALVGMLTLYVGDRDVAKELAQDALVKMIRDWNQVRSMDNPAGWLTAVAFNQARSWWRRRYAEQRARRRHGPTQTATEVPDTEMAMVVRAAVAGLPDRQRQAIILRYFDDCSVAETARIMGCADGTVKALTSQARATLRDRGLHGVKMSPRRDENTPDAADGLTVVSPTRPNSVGPSEAATPPSTRHQELPCGLRLTS